MEDNERYVVAKAHGLLRGLIEIGLSVISGV